MEGTSYNVAPSFFLIYSIFKNRKKIFSEIMRTYLISCQILVRMHTISLESLTSSALALLTSIFNTPFKCRCFLLALSKTRTTQTTGSNQYMNVFNSHSCFIYWSTPALLSVHTTIAGACATTLQFYIKKQIPKKNFWNPYSTKQLKSQPQY